MKFALKITLGNDSMLTGADVARALRETAMKIASEPLINGMKSSRGLGSRIMDENGNVVGAWRIVA